MAVRSGAACFTICYFVVVIALRMHSRALVINEMVSFATEYGQVQKRLLKNLELPYCVLDDTGRIIWTNYEFDRVVHEEKTTRRQISSFSLL